MGDGLRRSLQVRVEQLYVTVLKDGLHENKSKCIRKLVYQTPNLFYFYRSGDKNPLWEITCKYKEINPLW